MQSLRLGDEERIRTLYFTIITGDLQSPAPLLLRRCAGMIRPALDCVPWQKNRLTSSQLAANIRKKNDAYSPEDAGDKTSRTCGNYL